MIELKGDVKAFERQLNRIQRRVIPVAVPRAINDTIRQINTQVRREMAQDLGLKQKDFKSRLKMFRANRRNWEGKNWVGTRVKIPVSKVFKSGKAGIRYLKKLGVVNLNDIFTAIMPGGHEGLFSRKEEAARSSGRANGRTRRGRLPIEEIHIDLGPAATRAVNKWGPLITKTKFRGILAGKLTELLRKQR